MPKIVKISEKPSSERIDTMKDFAKLIKYQRTKLGLTRDYVAAICSINYKTLQNIEDGNEQCDIGKVLFVAKMLGIKISGKVEDA